MDHQALDENYFRSQGLMMNCSLAGTSRETDHVHLRSVGAPIREFNIAHLRLPVRDLDAALKEARTFFGDLGLPYRLTIRESAAAPIVAALAPQGWRVMRSVPGMALEPIRSTPTPVQGLSIARVNTDAELEDFQETSFAGFGFPPAGAAAFLPRALFESPGVAGFVGYLGAEPVATALLIITGRVAGIYFVATLEPHRQRGLGERLTWAAIEEGMGHGCTVASLQASEMGKPVYARMGFVPSGNYLELESAE